ncbi:hypothetical protein DAI22_07g134300 [Oryza sativa Japonica Group]|nr:hypothetical protein DAI22_07g134300 [Oryza sativa Japonica Group]
MRYVKCLNELCISIDEIAHLGSTYMTWVLRSIQLCSADPFIDISPLHMHFSLTPNHITLRGPKIYITTYTKSV